MNVFRLTIESFRFAWQALKSNVLRTTLSLLGVTVGIFAIIAVFTIVDALESNVKGSLNKLGDNVVYLDKWAWYAGNNYPWWKYFNRPAMSYSEFKFLDRYLEHKKAIAILDEKGNVTLKNGSNSINGASVQGISFEYNLINDFPVTSGRYFSVQEMEAAREVAIIGDELAKTLFPNTDPIGKTVKIRGIKFLVLGVLERQGESILNFGTSMDLCCYIPYGTFSKMFQGKYAEPNIIVKGLDTDPGLQELEGEITGLLRARRSLKPLEDSNFAINRPEIVANALASIFGVLNIASWVIGGFSLLVGGFGIANIMFVSVRERTNIIGIQKSLGAKNAFILLQFLFEAIFLSLIGGGFGILLVFLITQVVPMGSLQTTLSITNILWGFGIASIIGTMAGIIPAALAARMDPVIAIRSK